jgi:hypothetical protein
MRVSTHLLIATVLATFWPAVTAAQARPDPGDYIVTGFTTAGGQLLRVNATSTGGFTTLQTFASAVGRATGVTMDEDNRSLAVLLQVPGGSAGRLVRFEPGSPSKLSTLVSFGTSSTGTLPSSACWTQDGELVISVADGHLLRYDPEVPFRVTTLYKHTLAIPRFRHVTTSPGQDYDFVVVNGQNAPYLIGINNLGKLTRNFNTQNLGDAVAVSHDYGAARFAVTRQYPLPQLGDFLHVSPGTGGVTTLASLAFMPIAHRYTQRDTHVVLGTNGTLQELDRKGTAIRTIRLKVPSGFVGSGLAVYGNNRLHVETDRQRHMVFFDLNDSRAAKKAYALVLSTGSTGGLPLQTKSGPRRINLRFDPLLLLSLLNGLPGILQNASGMLDAGGHATVVVRSPQGLGSRHIILYAAWVSYDQSGIFSVSETEHFVLP